MPTQNPYDHDDGVTQLEEDIGAELETLQRLEEEFEAAKAALAEKLAAVVKTLAPDGSVIKRVSPEWGRISTVRGNDRRAQAFEVVRFRRLVTFDPSSPDLTRAELDVYPLNDKGQRLSGRAGNQRSYARDVDDTCTILLCVNGMVGPDDKRSSNDILIDTVRRAALKRSFLALPATVRQDLAENADYLA